MQTGAGPVPAGLCLVDMEGLFSWSPPSLWLLQSSHLLFLRIPELSGERFDETSNLDSLRIMSGFRFLYLLPFAARRRLSDDG